MKKRRRRLTKVERRARKNYIIANTPERDRLLSELIDLKLRGEFENLRLNYVPKQINRLIMYSSRGPNETFFSWIGNYKALEEWELQYKDWWWTHIKPLYNWEIPYVPPKSHNFASTLFPITFDEAMNIVKTHYDARAKPQNWDYWHEKKED